MDRVEAGIKKVIKNADGTECMIYGGRWQIEIALSARVTTSAINVIGHAIGMDYKDLNKRVTVNCGQRRCVSPDHVIQVSRLEAVTINDPNKESRTVSAFKRNLDRMERSKKAAPFGGRSGNTEQS